MFAGFADFGFYRVDAHRRASGRRLRPHRRSQAGGSADRSVPAPRRLVAAEPDSRRAHERRPRRRRCGSTRPGSSARRTASGAASAAIRRGSNCRLERTALRLPFPQRVNAPGVLRQVLQAARGPGAGGVTRRRAPQSWPACRHPVSTLQRSTARAIRSSGTLDALRRRTSLDDTLSPERPTSIAASAGVRSMFGRGNEFGVAELADRPLPCRPSVHGGVDPSAMCADHRSPSAATSPAACRSRRALRPGDAMACRFGATNDAASTQRSMASCRMAVLRVRSRCQWRCRDGRGLIGVVRSSTAPLASRAGARSPHRFRRSGPVRPAEVREKFRVIRSASAASAGSSARPLLGQRERLIAAIVLRARCASRSDLAISRSASFETAPRVMPMRSRQRPLGAT